MSKKLTTVQQYPLQPDTPLQSLLCGVSFNSATDRTQLFALQKNGKTLSVHTKNTHTALIKGQTHSYDDSTAHYVNIFPETDLYCNTLEKEFICKLIIKKSGTTTFPFLVKTQQLRLERLKSEHKIVCLDPQTSMCVFEINALLIVDDNGETCPTINYTMQKLKDGTLVTLKPNQSWIKAKKRAFPLAVYAQVSYKNHLTPPATGFDDITAAGLSFPIGLQHRFVSSGKNHTDYQMNVGSSWRLNIMQSVTPEVNKQGETLGFIYLDGEGKLYKLRSVTSHSDDLCISSESIGNLKVHYSHCCDIAYGYDDDLHTYYSDFHSHIKYDPEHRILNRDTLHYYFDESGRLIRIVNDRRVSLNIELKKGRIHCVSNHKQKIQFAYKGKNLAAIILPNHDRIHYNYAKNDLAEVIFTDGRKFKFSTSD